ncbi:hypothetical protein Patl1_31836 [Pistacia atlantica]|uniref:Uncharacterized protein n=1 Tax=Pistacia atlantica TaxID=434234 RepID=A0ACC1AQ61_9ROSI|nr:hypothetical protein Patl1_31836 [Pistacia atlantica]
MGSNSDEIITENMDAPTYAPSLPVPNVQEMILVIDLSLLSTGDVEELNKLDLACKEWGFFQVVNHGVAKEVLQNMKDAAAEFFALPLEKRKKYKVASNDIQGYGQAYVVSEDQILDWSDALMLIVYPSHYRKLNFLPRTPTGFKEIIESFSNGVKEVGEELLRSFSRIMGMDKDALLGLHKQGAQGMRVNYYPTCSRPDLVLGLSPHSDASTITILMQEDDTEGLQIKHNDEWVPVKPVQDALVVNVGDVIEIWSNGKYKSIEHRAVTNQKKARISYASFIVTHDDVEIEPLDHQVGSQKVMYQKVR